jgi:hypothetical protein
MSRDEEMADRQRAARRILAISEAYRRGGREEALRVARETRQQPDVGQSLPDAPPNARPNSSDT